MDSHVPEPSVRTFEQFLGRVVAARRCDGCGKPLGSAPRRHVDKRQYHPKCHVPRETTAGQGGNIVHNALK